MYDACVWIGQAQKFISQETVQKCSGKCGFVSDLDMDCTVAESCTTDSELSTATNSLNLENPVTAEEFLNFDNDTAAEQGASTQLKTPTVPS